MVDKVVVGGLGVSMVFLLSLGFFIYNGVENPNYYCEDTNMMAYCYSLSGTEKTCYTLPLFKGGKRCSSLWNEIEYNKEIEVPEAENWISKSDFTRDPDGIHCYTKGDLKRKVNCDGI